MIKELNENTEYSIEFIKTEYKNIKKENLSEINRFKDNFIKKL